MFVVEILGLFTKPFALAVRLFANMTAGHVVILSLIGLIFIMKTYFVAPVSLSFALFIYLLEILENFRLKARYIPGFRNECSNLLQK